MMRRLSLIIMSLVLLSLVSLGHSDNSDRTIPISKSEIRDRDVDEVALKVKLRAIKTLLILAKKEANRSDEPTILIRLAEAIHDAANIQFRIAYGKNIKSNQKNQKIRSYKSLLSQALDPLNRLISAYPNSHDIARAYYLRGKTQKELGNLSLATADYKTVIIKYPNSRDAPFSHLALWDLLMEKQDYRGVIAAINQYAAKPSDRHYGLAVTRLAWCLYYLDDVPGALKFIKQSIQYYAIKARTSKSAQQDIDKALSDATLFYATGIEKKIPGLDANSAIDYFTTIYGKGDPGKSLVELSYLLRAKGQDEILQKFKNLAIQSTASDGYKYELLLINFEHQLNRRRFVAIKADLEEILAFIKKSDLIRKNPEKIQKSMTILTSATTTLQSALIDYKDTDTADVIAPTLFSLYEFMLKTSVKDNKTQFKTHFNLAETAKEMKDYNRAVMHYRWIVKYRSAAPTDISKITDDATFRAITTQFEYLKQKNEITKNLDAKKIDHTEPKKLSTSALNWITWVDDFPEGGEKNSNIDVYRFEVARLVYSHGMITDALKRLDSFISEFPQSSYATPAAALKLDTLIASEKWEEVYESALSFYKSGTFSKNSIFQSKLQTIASDGYYKLTELAYKEKKYKETIERSNHYIKTFPSGNYRKTCLELAANAALALNNKTLALNYLAPLEKESPNKNDIKALSALTSASLAEESYNFSKSIQEYIRFFNLPADHSKMSHEDRRTLARKTLLLAWISSHTSDIHKVLSQKKICLAAGQSECDKYHSRLLLTTPSKKTISYKTVMAQSNSEERFIYAVLALEQAHRLSFDDRLKTIDLISSDWEKQDGLLKYTVLHFLSHSIPDALISSRKDVQKLTRVSLDQTKISRRVKLIEKMETHGDRLAKLPWIGIKVTALNEIANLYQDLSSDILKIPTPAGLTLEDLKSFRDSLTQITSAFDQKKQTLKIKAAEFIFQYGVEPRTAEQIAVDLELPAQPKNQKTPHELVSGNFPGDILRKPEKDDDSYIIYSALTEALQNKNWPRIAFLIQEEAKMQSLDPGYLELFRGTSFMISGALSEGLVDFFESKNKIAYELSPRITFILLSSFYRSYAKEKTRLFVDSMLKAKAKIQQNNWLSPEDYSLIKAAAQWSEYQNISDLNDTFSRMVAGSSDGADS